MKGVCGNPALDAYDRMSVSAVRPAKPVRQVPAGKTERAQPKEAAKVSISAEARELAGAKAEDSVDAQKVTALKNRIAEGTFKLDSQLIAHRILDRLG